MTNREKGLEFEKQCLIKLVELNFLDLSLTKNTDNGADIIGVLNGSKYVFQCKNHKRSQGNRCVQEVIAAQRLYKANRSVVISCSPFTAQAVALAKANNCILLIASEFFELAEFPPKGYAEIFNGNTLLYDFDYQLIERYEEVKKSIGRVPKWDELSPNVRYLIVKNYRNYGNFLSSIGDVKHTSVHDVEQLRKEYIRNRTLLGKVPTGSEIRAYSTFPYNQFHSYPLTKLQEECGDRPNIKRGVAKDKLTSAYFALEKRLGHPPTIKEIDELGEYRSSYYAHRWGSFDGFLSEIGRTRTEAGLPRVYTKEEIVSIYSLIKILLSLVKESEDFLVNQTTLERLIFCDRVLISPSTYSNRNKFGSWKAFMDYLEENDISSNIVKLAERIKRDGIDVLFSIVDEQ